MEQGDKYRVIEVGDGFQVLEWLYNDIPIMFRVYPDNPDRIEMKFDDNFALANGYLSKRAMIAACCKKGNIGVLNTDWVRVLEDGNFYLESRLRLKSVLQLPTSGTATIN